ncbi:MAG: putative 4-hydroxybenzoate polyprenyltransferase [Defluviitaleaceae bacterium]|nr:putative 4-hydroxybenzoate polyprenyltransferase [Defluviitaleaceae bacterium]
MKRVLKKLKYYANHTLFLTSLTIVFPAGVAVVFAAEGLPDFWTMFWIFVALIATRLGGNSFNRIADRKIDALNPRTENRDMVSGRIKLAEAWGLTVIFFGILVFAAWNLNFLCFILSPVAIALAMGYSLTKRFTWMCHYVLGFVFGGAIVAVWIAIRGTIEFFPFLFGAALMFWVAGRDLVLSTLDENFDAGAGLYSIPARFGVKAAIIAAVLSKFIFLAILTSFPIFIPELGAVYLAGMGAIFALQILESALINPHKRRRMLLTSFIINNVIIVIFFLVALADYFFV